MALRDSLCWAKLNYVDVKNPRSKPVTYNIPDSYYDRLRRRLLPRVIMMSQIRKRFEDAAAQRQELLDRNNNPR